jgi:biopolymer transport protein ExbD
MPLKPVQDELPSMNMTPMIDVVFLLLIFFMVGTKMSDSERSIALQVPVVKDAAPLTEAPSNREILVFEDGRLELDRRAVTLDELRSELTAAKREYADLGVIVRGDAKGEFQNVATVLSACREAGIDDMGISVRVASGVQSGGASRR